MTALRTGHVEIAPPADFAPFERSRIEQSLVAAFEAQVSKAPARTAVKTATMTLTYGALNAWANRIARGLLANRPRRAEPVALLFEQGAAGVAAILAVLKAGKFYLSLDPGADPADHQAVLAHSGCALLVSGRPTPAQREAVAGLSVDVLTIDRISTGQPDENLGLALSPKTLAYIFYTSGSTGRPKGVVDNHRNVLHNIMRYTNRLGIAPSDRLSLLQPPSFSGTVSSLFAALLNGATLYPFDLRKRGFSDLAELLVGEAITIYHSVPAIFRSLLAGDRRFPAVRVVRLEGDQASSLDLALFKRHFGPHCVLANGLGLTEAGLVRQLILPHGVSLEGDSLPVGDAVEDMTTSILDPQGRPAPLGSSGEIAVSSPYLALGYWREPELTRAKFLSADGEGGRRTYLTGDLGRLRADGCLEHLGRLDARVKIRGQWADLADVGASLLKLDAFSEVVVRSWDEGCETPRLVAYYVAADLAVPSPGEIRTKLGGVLPAHMIPARFIRLESLPLTSNGKVDHAALPAPGRERPGLAVPYRPPADALQDQLVGIWEQLLGVASVGIDDPFLDLGGDSLLAMILLLTIEDAFDRPFRQDLLLEAQTVAQLARALAGDLAGRPPAAALTLQEGGTRAPFFFLHGDYRSGGYFCHRIAKGIDRDRPFYVLPPLLPGRPPSDTTIEALAKRHLQQVRAIQPRGPFYLGGNCNGGLIAFEMARQLQAQGDEIDALVMVSTPVKILRHRSWYRTSVSLAKVVGLEPDRRVRLLRRLRWYMEDLEARSGWDQVRFFRAKWDKLRQVLAARLQGAPGRPQDEPLRVTGRGPEREDEVIADAYMQACNDYVPDDYDGRVVLFWPHEDRQTPEQARAAWAQLCARIELHQLPGNHLSCLSRHGAEFAEKLNVCLAGGAREPEPHPEPLPGTSPKPASAASAQR